MFQNRQIQKPVNEERTRTAARAEREVLLVSSRPLPSAQRWRPENAVMIMPRINAHIFIMRKGWRRQ